MCPYKIKIVTNTEAFPAQNPGSITNISSLKRQKRVLWFQVAQDNDLAPFLLDEKSISCQMKQTHEGNTPLVLTCNRVPFVIEAMMYCQILQGSCGAGLRTEDVFLANVIPSSSVYTERSNNCTSFKDLCDNMNCYGIWRTQFTVTDSIQLHWRSRNWSGVAFQMFVARLDSG